MIRPSLFVSVFGLLVAAPAVALAAGSNATATIEVTDEAVVFRASDGAANQILVGGNDVEGTINLVDASGVAITSTTCEVDGSNATCPRRRILALHLGDMDDYVYSDAPYWTVPAVFSFHGGSGDDSLEGNIWGYGDVLFGNKGDDRITGRSGFDHIMGGPGNDEVNGGTYGDGIWGGRGSDRVEGDNGPDGIAGGPGVDRLKGERGDDYIDSRDGMKDYVFGGAGKDTVVRDRFDVVRGIEKVE